MRQDVEATVRAYRKARPKAKSIVFGFIRKNKFKKKTPDDIDAILTHVTRDKKGNLIGEGEKFKAWCIKHGRVEPDADLVDKINADPAEARGIILGQAAMNPWIYRAYCTYLSGRGRSRV